MSSREFPASNSSTSAGSPSSVIDRKASGEGLSKLRTSTIATPASDRPSGVNNVSRGTQTPSEWRASSPSSSPPTNGEVKKASTLKVKAKKSFRNLFAKSESKSTTKVPQPVSRSTEPKRPSTASSTKTLKKRISKNFEKVNPFKKTDIPDFEMQNLEVLVKQQAAEAARETAATVEEATKVAVGEVEDEDDGRRSSLV